MKPDKTKPAQPTTNPSVRLEFSHPTAKAIFIAGTFNHWSPEATAMTSNGLGRWSKVLSLPPGIYEYRLIIDGQWLTDPFATAKRPNPFGSFNSVLIVPASAETAERPALLWTLSNRPAMNSKKMPPAFTDVSCSGNVR